MPGRPASPAVTYHRLAHLCAPLGVTVAPLRSTRSGEATHPALDADEPTVSAAGLATRPADLDAAVAGESDRLLGRYGRRPRADVAASRLLHHYLWSVCLLFSGPWFLDRRVPRLPATRVRLAPRTGALTLDPRGVALPAAPAGPEAVRDAVAAHVGPVLAAFAPRVRRGPHALWGMATDDLASGLWFLGRATGDEERGRRAAEAVLPGGTPPFPGAAAFRTLRAPGGRPHTTRTRIGCCLHYAAADADPCLTCPRLTDTERLRRLEAT